MRLVGVPAVGRRPLRARAPAEQVDGALEAGDPRHRRRRQTDLALEAQLQVAAADAELAGERADPGPVRGPLEPPPRLRHQPVRPPARGQPCGQPLV
jgi:hypothetical protein